ncbi:class B sortase [Ruminococcus sp.]|uniref:class B sortase n=1 Tax=Ruminococcus sp. TaxID=41978 RepID=UPI0025DFAB74|nr:class B sortase [Ruminococcus sp.]
MKGKAVLAFIIMLVCAGAYCAYRYYKEDVLPQKQIDDAYDEATELFGQIRPETRKAEIDAEVVHDDLLSDAKKVNNRVVGWISIPDTHIDFPIAQADDNDFYLHNGLDGTYNYELGCPFLDYRCEFDFSGFNSIVYAHHMTEQRMFADISLFTDSTFMKEHSKGYLTLHDRVYSVKFFAYLNVYPTAPVYHAIFMTAPDKKEYLEYIFKEAKYTQMTGIEELDENVNLLLLSTCTYEYNDARGVLVGVIEPKIEKQE